MSQIIVEDHEDIKSPFLQEMYKETVANIAKAVMATVTEEVGRIIVALEVALDAVEVRRRAKGGAK